MHVLKHTKNTIIFLFIIVISLIIFDVGLMLLGLFPPSKPTIGNKHVGFPLYLKQENGEIIKERSWHPRFKGRNDGILLHNEYDFRSSRSVKDILEKPLENFILVLGDSHTDLPYRNELTHPFILEQVLIKAGVSSTEVFNAGVAKYSPLQCYHLYKYNLKKFKPKIIILNLYIGNDFYDLIRIDDRPYFVEDGDRNYKVHPPEWFKYGDPESQGGWAENSRILFLLDKCILRKIQWARIKYLLKTCREYNKGFLSGLRYIRDIRNSVEPSSWYPGAFSAQILNQQLFFKRFPKVKDESINRLSYLLYMMKEENPEVLFIMSPVPSATMVGALEGEPVLLDRIDKVGLELDSIVKMEEELYEACRDAATAHGWLFVDTLQLFKAYPKPQDLYMAEDLHISPEGSQLIGKAEASAILPILMEKKPFRK